MNICLTFLIFACAALWGQSPTVAYQEVAPIVNERCIICHNGPTAPRGLQLTGYKNILQGSENGPVVNPGDPASSELIKRIKGVSTPRMPLTGPPFLSDEQIALIEQWVAQGAKEKAAPAASLKPAEALPEKAAPVAEPSPRSEVATYADVEPIFKMRCMKCHNTKGLMGPPPEGLLLNSYENILSSADRARVIPGYPEASELVRRIRGQALPLMPFDGPPYLSNEEIQLIIQWIAQGARDVNGQAAEPPIGAKLRLHGLLTGRWELDGLPLKVGSGVRLKKAPDVGDYVRVRGRLGQNGQILVDRIRRR